jgi:sec-independent protein translocase protein TatC
MLLMAVPMIVLFEGAIQIARVVDKRRAKRADVEHFHDLPDDEPSPLDAHPTPLDDAYDPTSTSTRS